MDIQTVSFALCLALKVFTVYFAVIVILGLRRMREYDDAAPRTRFGIVVAARNEERVIGALVESLLRQDYPRELFDIYVVPNNCSDDTEGAALSHGANVIRCTGRIRSKGDALRQAFRALDAKNYDAYCVFDADNVVDSRFLREMNKAFCAGARVAKGVNRAKNPYDSWVAGCYGIYFGVFDVIFNRPRQVTGRSAKLIGTGFAVRKDALEALGGWNTETIAEDAEFAADCALAGERVWWVPRAVAYDEEPNSFKVSLYQRKRWCSGVMQVAGVKLPGLLRGTLGRSWKLCLDFSMFLMTPFSQAISAFPLAVTIVSLLAGKTALTGVLLGLLLSLAGTMAFAGAVAYISGYRDARIIKSVVMFPIFMASFLPLQVISLFRKTTVWREVGHGAASPEPLRARPIRELAS